MEAKPFAVGLRIIHSQDMININQYGIIKHKYLKQANYKLTHRTKDGRGVYTFCMCLGGYVVNAASEHNRLCINGMSYYKRDSGCANSAVVVTVDSSDYGTGVFDGIEFQKKLEEKAYNTGHGSIPISLFGDYENSRLSVGFGKVIPSIKGRYTFANVNDILPENINKSIIEAIYEFDKKINGFANSDSVIAGVESRTSSPIRLLRDDNHEANILGIYPCGEGSGYAGGITSSAIDGLITFEKIASKYRR